MRELILLRHAHAEQAGLGQDDIDRPLSRQGLAEAEAAGKWLQQHHLLPDRIVYSSARRTRETLEEVLQVTGFIEQRQESRIYNATPGMLMEVADEHRECARLMLVGHNPGLEQLVALLSSGQSGDFRGLPAAGIVVLLIPAGAEFEPGIASMEHFWWP